MKNLCWLLILLFLVIACKKNVETSDSDWTFSDQLFTEKIVDLQKKAGANYFEWSKTMDSASVGKKLQQYFLNDHSVTSATTGSQGLYVEYSNGMLGGVFLGSDENFGKRSLKENNIKESSSDIALKSIVNRKKAIFISPVYNQYSYVADAVIQHYNKCLPNVGFSLQSDFKDSKANLDCFTKLSGYGIISIITHGWAVPSESDIKDVYIMTGEEVNMPSIMNNIKDLKTRKIMIGMEIIPKSKTGRTLYWINDDFIKSHNDFSKDTVLFYGGFCFSSKGNWYKFPYNCANSKGAYFGFNWKVRPENCRDLEISLIDSLCNINVEGPYTPEKWMNGPQPGKSYWDYVDKRVVSINYVGDKDLALWKDSLRIETRPITEITDESATSGGMIKSDGGYKITSKGVCWSKNPHPTIADSKTTDGSGKENYTSIITGLEDIITYYIRAYATNSKGTTYGNELTFNTPNYDLNGYWLANDGHGNKIDGKSGFFYSFSSIWQEVANAGLVSIGSESMRSITKIDKFNWTCDILWWQLSNSVYSISWVSGSTVNMNTNGQSIAVTSTNPLDPNDIRTKIFERVSHKSAHPAYIPVTVKNRNSGY